MATNLPYELKGTLRSGFEVDKAQLKDFRALESDWREIFRWIMSIAGDMPYYDETNKISGTMAALWHNDVLTVLVEIRQKNLKEYATSYVDGSGTAQQNTYTADLQNKINGWIDRLSIYLNNAFASDTVSQSMRVAENIREQLRKSLPIVPQPTPRRRNFIHKVLEENNRPYFSMLGALLDIQSKFDYYMQQIESSGDMDASQALLLTFVRSYCRIVQQFNDKFAKLPNFYRREILKATQKEAVQDSTFVLVNPNKDVTHKTFSLPAGTRFNAGENADGAPLYYSLTEKSYIVPTIIKSARALFPQGRRIITAPLALDGTDSNTLFSTANPVNTQQELGWALSSPMLSLSEGERKVFLYYMMDGGTDIARLLATASPFRLFTSGSEDWTEKAHTATFERAGNYLLFSFTIADGEEALVPCSSDIHGIETEYPAVRILIDEIPAIDVDITSIKFKDIQVRVSVSDIRTFSLYSDVGEMDSSQPFYPFGTVGEKGSWFIFGSEELAIKKILNVSLKGTWNKLPDGGYTAVYKDYALGSPVTDSSFKAVCEWLENSRWNVCRNSPVQLFCTDASGNIKEEAEFHLDIADFSPLAVGSTFRYNKKAKGFYRIRLSEPSIGFGMDVYRQQFAEVMVHNSKAKERNQKPVPAMPQMPMIADAVLGYTAMDSFGENDRLYRINETNGYEIVNLGTESIQLLPNLRKHYLYLNLDDVEGLKRIRLYFSLRYMRRGSHGSTLASSGDSIIEYYDNEACQWKVFPTECILQEDSDGLTRSGFITLNTFDETNTSFIKGNEVWIRIGFENDIAPENIIVDGIWLNCFKVLCENGDGSPLPAGAIASLAEDDPRVLEVLQPMEGYGGKAAEDEQAMSVRLATRISTRNRGLNIGDYEKLILERFSDIEKICCIPASQESNEIRIVVFPQPEKRVFPQLPNWKLSEIEQYIKGYMSPFAEVCVINPTYEPLTVDMIVILKDSVQDEGEVQRRLYRRIYNYFVQWLVDEQLPELGKQYSYEGLKAWLVNDEGIERCVSLTITGGKSLAVLDDEGNTEDVYHFSSEESGILYPKRINIEMTGTGDGIEDSSIGMNFIIG